MPGEQERIATTIGSWWDTEGPLYMKLASALGAAIERGDLAPGTRLPPERLLATTLDVSRTTVVAGYRELARRGLVNRRQGSGTWIRHPVQGEPVPYPNEAALDSIARNPLMRTARPDGSRTTVDFGASLQPSIGPLMRELMADIADDIERLVMLSGYQPFGLPALRTAVAHHIEATTGLRTSEEEILITTGSQQAIWLIGQTYTPFGENVLLESPGYPGAMDAFRMMRARVQALPVEPTRTRVDLLNELMEEHHPRLILLSPSCQAPTGATMTEPDRRVLIDSVDAHQVTTIDDQTMAELLIEPATPTPLAAISDTAPVITIGSISKLFWPGLRIGWIRAPKGVIQHLAQAKAVSDMGSSLISQLFAVRLLEKAPRLREIRIAEITACLDRIADALAEHLPEWTWTRPSGGLSLWIQIPSGSASRFAQIALLHGVTVVPGSSLTVDGSCDDHIRIQFVQNPETATLGIRRLAKAWHTFQSQMPLAPALVSNLSE
jgi:DNA-binding transcriptional MocR family regulator